MTGDWMAPSLPVVASEKDIVKWFLKNYTKLGFQKILEGPRRSCPDFIMLDSTGTSKKVEIEFMSSGFRDHGHSPKEVDVVICGYVDEKIEGIEIIQLRGKHVGCDFFAAFHRKKSHVPRLTFRCF